MPSEDVIVTMSARDAELVRAWQRAKMGPKEYREELNRTGAAGKKLDKTMAETLTRQIAKWGSVTAAVGLFVSQLKQAIDMEMALDKLRSETATTREEALAKYLNQSRTSGVSEEERTQLAQQAETQGSVYGQTPPQQLDLLREVVSLGVDVKAAPEFLEVANKFATAQGAKLDVDMLRAFTSQTRVQDDKLGVRAAEETAKAFFGAFLTRQIQPQQLEPFSRQNYQLKQAGLSAAQQIAVNTASLDIYGGSAEQAATFDRAFFGKLRAAEGRPEAKKALDQMGVSTKDVDFVGEDLQQVLERLAAAIDKMPEEARAPKLTKVFGEEYGAQALAFIQNRQKVYDIEHDIEQGQQHFEPAVKQLTDTNAARQRKAAAVTEQARAANGQPELETVIAAMRAEMEKEGRWAFTQWWSEKEVRLGNTLDKAAGYGGDRDRLLDWAAWSGGMRYTGSGREEFRQQLEGYLPPAPTKLERHWYDWMFGGSRVANPEYRQPPPAGSAAPSPQSSPAPAQSPPVSYRAEGGIVGSGPTSFADTFRPIGTDTVPAMLTPGEFVVNARSAAVFRAELEAINDGQATKNPRPDAARGYQEGGPVASPVILRSRAPRALPPPPIEMPTTQLDTEILRPWLQRFDPPRPPTAPKPKAESPEQRKAVDVSVKLPPPRVRAPIDFSVNLPPPPTMGRPFAADAGGPSTPATIRPDHDRPTSQNVTTHYRTEQRADENRQGTLLLLQQINRQLAVIAKNTADHRVTVTNRSPLSNRPQPAPPFNPRP